MPWAASAGPAPSPRSDSSTTHASIPLWGLPHSQLAAWLMSDISLLKQWLGQSWRSLKSRKSLDPQFRFPHSEQESAVWLFADISNATIQRSEAKKQSSSEQKATPTVHQHLPTPLSHVQRMNRETAPLLTQLGTKPFIKSHIKEAHCVQKTLTLKQFHPTQCSQHSF